MDRGDERWSTFITMPTVNDVFFTGDPRFNPYLHHPVLTEPPFYWLRQARLYFGLPGGGDCSVRCNPQTLADARAIADSQLSQEEKAIQLLALYLAATNTNLAAHSLTEYYGTAIHQHIADRLLFLDDRIAHTKGVLREMREQRLALGSITLKPWCCLYFCVALGCDTRIFQAVYSAWPQQTF